MAAGRAIDMANEDRQPASWRIDATLVMTTIAIVVIGVAAHTSKILKPLLIQSYIHAFGMAPSLAGYLLTVEMTAASLGTILATVFAQKLRSRAVLGAALLLIFACDVASIFVASADPQFLFGLRFAAGVGTGFGLGRLAIAIAFVSRPDRVGGLYTVLSSAFAAFAAFVVQPLQSVVGPPAIFVIAAFLIPVALPLLRWFPTEAPVRKAVRAASTVDLRVKAIIVVGMAFYYLGLGAYWPFVGVIGGRSGVSPETVSTILGAAGLVSISAPCIAVLFGDRSRTSLLICMLLALGVAGVALPLLLPSSVIAYVVSTCLVIFSWFAAFPFLLGLMSRLDPSGRMNGLLYILAAIGFAVGPGIAGWLIGRNPDPLVGAALLQEGTLVCLGLGSAVLCYFALRRTGRDSGMVS